MRMHSLLLLLAAVVFLAGCASMQRFAVNRVGDALSKQGEAFAADDDPELVGAATPFGLKMIESLLAQNPRHAGLLLAAARGFTQYTFAWVETPARDAEADDPDRAAEQIDRASRLYCRARDYGLRGLEVAHAGFRDALAADPAAAMQKTEKRDVPLLYWTAASWGLAISVSKDRPELVADLPVVEAMIDRALALDESFDAGAIHSFLITYELNRPGGDGDPVARSRRHFERAVELSGGKLASPYVTFAESVCVQTQDRREFDSLLQKAIAIDTDATPKWRLENRIAQQHARRLLAQTGEPCAPRDASPRLLRRPVPAPSRA
jgi:predicted anti-sigma-YlaC factor YlaD